MNGTNGNEPGSPEKALVPYPVILAATKGDPDAMKIVLQHFSGYMARLSMRKLYDERGNVYFGVDHDIRERPQAKLMMPSSVLFCLNDTIPFSNGKSSKAIKPIAAPIPCIFEAVVTMYLLSFTLKNPEISPAPTAKNPIERSMKTARTSHKL